MRDLQSWLAEYGESHRHPVNRRLHFLCIPLIVLAILAALKSVPVGTDAFNPATALIALLLIYYAVLSLRLALGMLLVFAVLYALVLALEAATGTALPIAALVLFVTGWAGQFYGHHLEGVRPAFLKDLQFLLIGPLWELAHVYDTLGLHWAPSRHLSGN